MRPLVTVVTPAYDAAPYIETYLESLTAQTWRPLEVIIVDDGSTDETPHLLDDAAATLGRAGITAKIARRHHGGQAAAVNAALPLVEGAYFALCDVDDRMEPQSLETRVAFLESHPEFAMVRSGFRVVNESNAEALVSIPDENPCSVFDDLFRGRAFCNGAYLLRSSLLFECYPERRIPLSPEGQNLQLLLPPASRTLCGAVPEVLFTYVRHAGSHTSAPRTFSAQRARIEGFARLRAELLPLCQCNRERYARLNEQLLDEAMGELLEASAAAARAHRSGKR